MYGLYDVGPGEGQQVIVSFQIMRMIPESFTPVIPLTQLVPLNHGAHGPIQNQDPLPRYICYLCHSKRKDKEFPLFTYHFSLFTYHFSLKKMTPYIHIFLILPLLGFLISLFIPDKQEAWLSRTAFLTLGTQLTTLTAFIIYWIYQGHQTLDMIDWYLWRTDDYQFFIDFCFDKITATYALVGAFLTFLITIYSRYYLHRESGYKRFFNTILFFYLGYNITIFSGNFETLFIGWEILGISSFLLIAFYRDRYLPVKNALRVFSIYRIGDVGLILAMWASHHLFGKNVTFQTLNDLAELTPKLENHTFEGAFIGLMILLAAAAKSAQLPFSSWLPRAMEGPTPSSAIFYGSLSVHIGVFILLRTFPFWENQLSVRIIIGLLGLSTSAVATAIARVQSSIKSQVAYASISQIGLIFIEVALGFEYLALIHFAGNAFLRTYQLLVSPSVVSYLIKEQFYNFTPRKKTVEDSFPKKMEYTLYMLSLKEWNLESIVYTLLWKPFKRSGKKLKFLTLKNVMYFFVPIFLLGLYGLYLGENIPFHIQGYLSILFAIMGFMMVLKAFTERKSVLLSWILIIINHFCVAIAVAFNEDFEFIDVYLYLSGIVVAGALGYFALRWLKKREPSLDLNQFHGHSYEYPILALVFLTFCLGLAGFPITPTFIGEDLIFSHIHENQLLLALFVSLSFVVDGLSLIRLYARIFMGPHIKTYHEIAYKSS